MLKYKNKIHYIKYTKHKNDNKIWVGQGYGQVFYFLFIIIVLYWYCWCTLGNISMWFSKDETINLYISVYWWDWQRNEFSKIKNLQKI